MSAGAALVAASFLWFSHLVEVVSGIDDPAPLPIGLGCRDMAEGEAALSLSAHDIRVVDYPDEVERDGPAINFLASVLSRVEGDQSLKLRRRFIASYDLPWIKTDAPIRGERRDARLGDSDRLTARHDLSDAALIDGRQPPQVPYLHLGLPDLVWPIEAGRDRIDLDQQNRPLDPYQSTLSYLCRPLGGGRAILCGPPQQAIGRDQGAGEPKRPHLGWLAENAALGGLLLGGTMNFLGGWLYFYDERWSRWRWHGRRALGLCVIALAILIMVGGACLSTALGGNS